MGVLMIGSGMFLRMATLTADISSPVIDTVNWSTNKAYPSPLKHEMWSIEMRDVYDPWGEHHIDVAGVDIDSATVAISGSDGYSTSGEMTLYKTTEEWGPDDETCYDFRYNWQVPDKAGVTYTATFTVKDKFGNTATKTGYASIGETHGYFWINDEKVTVIDQHIGVNTLKLDFKFKADVNGPSIYKVWVKITKGTLDKTVYLTETTTDTEWTNSYTLPGEGKYTIEGMWTDTFLSEYQGMSIFVVYGDEEPRPDTPSITDDGSFLDKLFSNKSLQSWTMIGGGVVLIAIGLLRRP